MDESWRMRMGMPTPSSPPPIRQRPNYQPRRPSEDGTASHRRKPISDDPLNPEDFSDVFGGPPRTILSRQFSSGFPRSSSTCYFYEEIFRPPAKAAAPVRRSGRSLPEFRIPGQQRRERNGFYSDIFGWEDERVVRSRSRSKTSSSSVLSSEELSPLRPAFSADGDDDVSSFASKLRPINVKSRWNSRRMGNEDYQRQQNMMPNPLPPFSGNHHHFHNAENYGSDNLRSYPFGLSRRNASPETISLEPISNGSFRVSADDMELNSPSSPVSSVCHSLGQERKGREDEVLRPDALEQEEEDEAMSSYVIEINSDNREGTCESNGVDEAIAWAKEKFQTTQDVLNGHQVSEGHTDSFRSLDNQQVKWEIVEDEQQLECSVQTEMETLDEKMRLWSTGKEADIRLLLSSLHHILWPNSGWLPVPLANIIETSQVKKAYQRARLCLHPDKLQQRGATLQQKYIADKAFSILQDAWAAFISQETSRNLQLKICRGK
ncbi:hypothetical protein C2S53_017617 [Perilla frutescens var. hirtella]|uniref:Uncharacterized protein n=1 Tax=Perilla frutescens var. hirtella TaxID=608512 RepID=A0AAD4J2P5_PERFH|nr:hypothetical protein C2S53_017617 [Perilla frutescens var. hirtella]